MKAQRTWLTVLIATIATALVASGPGPTRTFAAAKKDTLHEAKQKCTENAKSAAPGVGHLAVETRKTVYARCMRRAGFYNER
jgi:hypothetical protein